MFLVGSWACVSAHTHTHAFHPQSHGWHKDASHQSPESSPLLQDKEEPAGPVVSSQQVQELELKGGVARKGQGRAHGVGLGGVLSWPLGSHQNARRKSARIGPDPVRCRPPLFSVPAAPGLCGHQELRTTAA